MMVRRFRFALPAVVLMAALWATGCSTGGETAREDPAQTADLSGLWVGWIASEQVVFGIVVPGDGENEFRARFITDDRQYLTPVKGVYGDVFPFDVNPLRTTPNTYQFSGDLAEYVWTESGQAYATSVDKKLLWGLAADGSFLGGLPGGSVRYYGPDNELIPNKGGFFTFFYNRAFDLSPNVQSLDGVWVIRDSWAAGNDLTLTITPFEANTTSGLVSGRDTRGNIFTGDIVIRYSPVPKNVYDVNLRMNNAVNLSGLASYILEMDTSGIRIEEMTLAIGLTSPDYTRAVGGLATRR